MPLSLWLCNLVVGGCVFGIALSARGAWSQGMDWIQHDVADRLRILRISSPQLRTWLNIWGAIVAATFFGLWLGLDSIVFGLSGAILLAAGPWMIIRRLALQRKQKIEDQMADAMVMFSSSIRAGLSLPQALDLLAQDCPRPIRQEFQQMIGEYKLGKPLDRTLAEAKARLRSENFILFAAALLASRESGGRLNETVERIGKSVLELQRLERKVMSETAQARKSAVYMAIAPAAILAIYTFLDPQTISQLFQTFPGQLMLSASVFLNLIAYLWALKILRADL